MQDETWKRFFPPWFEIVFSPLVFVVVRKPQSSLEKDHHHCRIMQLASNAEKHCSMKFLGSFNQNLAR
jgi:hypothetical protein